MSPVDSATQSSSITPQNPQATEHLKSSKEHGSKGTQKAKEAGRSFFQATKDAFIGTAGYAKTTGKQAGNVTLEAAARSRINSPYALISPAKGVIVAAVLAGAGWAAPKFTTASYAVTLTVPGVAFAAASLLLAAAVYSFFANVFHKPHTPAGHSAGDVHASLQSKVEEALSLENKAAALRKEIHEENVKIQKKTEAEVKDAKNKAKAADAVDHKAGEALETAANA